MRGPVIVAVGVAIAGAVFVLATAPSAPESREHDWLAAAFMATSSGIFFAAGTSPRRRLALLGAAYALFVGTAMAWLVESLLVWIVLAAATAAAIEGVRRVRRSAAPR